MLAALVKLGLKVQGDAIFDAKNKMFVYPVRKVPILREEIQYQIHKLSRALGVRVVKLKKAVESQQMYVMVQVTKPAFLGVRRAPNRTDEGADEQGPPFGIFSQVTFFCGGMSMNSKAGFNPEVEESPLDTTNDRKGVYQNVGGSSANSWKLITPDASGFVPGTPSAAPPIINKKRKGPDSRRQNEEGVTNKKLKEKSKKKLIF